MMVRYAIGRGDLAHLTLRMVGQVTPPVGFEVVDEGEREIDEVEVVRRRLETARAIQVAEQKAKEVPIL